MQPRILILRAPGTNCDTETAYAFQRADGQAEILHVRRVLESPQLLQDFQVLCVPGGFSYGDDIASGRIFGVQLQHHLSDAMREFKAAGKTYPSASATDSRCWPNAVYYPTITRRAALV